MAYCIVSYTVTLNDLEGHSVVARLNNKIRPTFVKHLARFRLTQRVARSLGDS